jgi:hypothetical protein
MDTYKRAMEKLIGEVERLGSPSSLYEDWHQSREERERRWSTSSSFMAATLSPNRGSPTAFS